MMSEEPTRRDFGKLAFSAVAASAFSGEAAANTPEILERDKTAAVERFMAKLEMLGNEEALTHVSSHKFWGLDGNGRFTPSQLREQFKRESEMRIPAASKLQSLQQKHSTEFPAFARKIKNNEHGIFLDGDEQAIFVVHKDQNGLLSLVKEYPIATSYAEWSNEDNSGGTPTGPMEIHEVRRGFPGEVISTLKQQAESAGERHFKTMRVTDDGRKFRSATFVRGITLKSQPVPEVISTAMLLDGARGIWIHGAPRKGLAAIPPSQRRNTAGSSGCIRISNVDAEDLARYVKVGTPVHIYGKNPERAPDLGWFPFGRKK